MNFLRQIYVKPTDVMFDFVIGYYLGTWAMSSKLNNKQGKNIPIPRATKDVNNIKGKLYRLTKTTSR